MSQFRITVTITPFAVFLDSGDVVSEYPSFSLTKGDFFVCL